MKKKFKICNNSECVELSESEIADLIKKRLINSKAIQNAFDMFSVSIDRINDLDIKIVPMSDSYGETDLNCMKLNENMFRNGDFFQKYFFVPCHEIVHFLSRAKEQDAWFNDPEEVMGFVFSIAYEIESGKDNDYLWNNIYPKVKFHFHDEESASEFFVRLINKAQSLLRQVQ